MGRLVFLKDAIKDVAMPPDSIKPSILVPRQEKLHQEYCELATKAQHTQDLDDGIAAGNAWQAFMNGFLPPITQDLLKAIKFPNRGSKL